MGNTTVVKTKEEIVREEYEKMFFTQKYDTSVNKSMNLRYFSPAMDQFAKQQAISFAKWITNVDIMPVNDGWIPSAGGKELSTEELYDLYLSQQTTSNG